MEISSITIIPIRGIPRVIEGHDIALLIFHALKDARIKLRDSDIIVITQKIVSKAEGMRVKLSTVRPSNKAIRLANELEKDPRLVEVVLRESRRVVRMGHGSIITETKHGFVCANSGVDQSNVEDGYLAVLPLDPDRSARQIRVKLERLTGKRLAVIITDTFGRTWREGQVDIAVGCSGIKPLLSLRGRVDHYGHELRVTEPAIVDEVAAASELAMKKLSMIPAAIVRGLSYERGESGVKSLIRSSRTDLFR